MSWASGARPAPPVPRRRPPSVAPATGLDDDEQVWTTTGRPDRDGSHPVRPFRISHLLDSERLIRLRA